MGNCCGGDDKSGKSQNWTGARTSVNAFQGAVSRCQLLHNCS